MARASACMDCREGADFAGLAGGGGTRSTAFIVFLDAGTPTWLGHQLRGCPPWGDSCGSGRRLVGAVGLFDAAIVIVVQTWRRDTHGRQEVRNRFGASTRNQTAYTSLAPVSVHATIALPFVVQAWKHGTRARRGRQKQCWIVPAEAAEGRGRGPHPLLLLAPASGRLCGQG